MKTRQRIETQSINEENELRNIEIITVAYRFPPRLKERCTCLLSEHWYGLTVDWYGLTMLDRLGGGRFCRVRPYMKS